MWWLSMNLKEILESNNIVESISDNLEYLLKIIPELKDMIGFEHKHPHHHLDVWNHTLYALNLSPNDFEIRLSLLLHDIGKPHSFIEGEVRHFPNHPLVSGEMTKSILTRLNYNNETIERICYLVKNHDNPINEEQVKNNRSLLYKRYIVQYCDAHAHNPDKLEKRVKYLNKVKNYFKEG